MSVSGEFIYWSGVFIFGAFAVAWGLWNVFDKTHPEIEGGHVISFFLAAPLLCLGWPMVALVAPFVWGAVSFGTWANNRKEKYQQSLRWQSDD